MNKKYFYTIVLSFLIANLYSRSMEFTSCKTYVKVEKNLEKGLVFGLEALEIEPDNSYIPFFIGQFIYRKQKNKLEAGKMFLEAMNRPDMSIENPYRIGKDTWIRTVHQAIARESYNWFNYGVDANAEKKYSQAIEYFQIASKLDKKLVGKCYSAISQIYYNNNEIDKAIEFIDVALGETTDSEIIINLKISKAQYLRKNKQIDEAFNLFQSIPEESLTLSAKNELFFIYMDNNDCSSAINLGAKLFIEMEENASIEMAILSQLAFNIAACYNQQADILYNEVIEYMASETKSNELTNNFLNQSMEIKDLYALAKDYYRLSLDYDEGDPPNQSTKSLKKKMRSDIRKIDNQVIPALENILK